MKFKALRRPPWRRKKSPSPPRPGHSVLPLDEALAGPPRRVDAAAYNELVTPRRSTLGLGTPDKSHIVFRAPRDHPPRPLQPDARIHLPRGLSRAWKRGDPSNEDDLNGLVGQECDTWAGVEQARELQGTEGHCITFFDKEPPRRGEGVAGPRGVAMTGNVKAGVSSGGQVPRENGRTPSPAQQHTTCFIDPRDAAWSPVCGACPGDEWAGVGAGGGAGGGARAAACLPTLYLLGPSTRCPSPLFGKVSKSYTPSIIHVAFLYILPPSSLFSSLIPPLLTPSFSAFSSASDSPSQASFCVFSYLNAIFSYLSVCLIFFLFTSVYFFFVI